MEKNLTIRYREFAVEDPQIAEERQLLEKAIAATDSAYAPYSHFHVGAAVLLEGGVVVTGSNQENIAYPSGLCAERVALFSASAQYPNKKILALAIVARNEEGHLTEASPCGACRQVFAEMEMRQQMPFKLISFLDGDKIRIIEGVENLLPFIFTFQ